MSTSFFSVLLLLQIICNYVYVNGDKVQDKWIGAAADIFARQQMKQREKMLESIENHPLLSDEQKAEHKKRHEEHTQLLQENILNQKDYEDNQFNNPLEMRDFETQHSFQHPLDMISQNWIILGDAVGTTNFARLTPSDGGRRGVLWNKFSLHLDEFQMLFEVHIHSHNKLGGDGFGVFLLNENEINRDNQGILGDFYGIRSDFNGTAIIFDTYDNNNNGDNPLIFSITNNGQQRPWNYENDLEDERNEISKGLPRSPMPTECTVKYRDNDEIKIFIRYQDKRLHIYTALEPEKLDIKKQMNKHDLTKNILNKHALPFAMGALGGGFPAFGQLFNKFGFGAQNGHNEAPHLCFIKSVDLSNFGNIHIAISASTGQLADNHDILKFETKYLRKEHAINDDLLERQGSKRRNTSVFIRIYWFIICTISVGLIAETISEILIIRNIYTKHYNIVKTINKINPFIQLSYSLYLVQYILLVFAFNWKCLLCNSPLLLIRAQKFMTNNVLLTPQKFEQPIFLYRTTYKQWLWVQLILLSFSTFYHFWRLFHM